MSHGLPLYRLLFVPCAGRELLQRSYRTNNDWTDGHCSVRHPDERSFSHHIRVPKHDLHLETLPAGLAIDLERLADVSCGRNHFSLPN
jgi:hypothetical protein